jgi:hypothetical protein
MNNVETYTATIYMAGDIETAKLWLRRYAYDHGMCATVTPTTFVYTGGEEAGFMVGLVNYPKFPRQPDQIRALASRLAHVLIAECCQKTAIIVATDRTEWIQVTPPGARK